MKKKTTKKARAKKQKAAKGKAQTQARAKAPKTPKAKKRDGCLDAAVKVLKETREAMSSKAMVETMLAKGWWKTNSKTPHATLYAAILREIHKQGAKARFKKVDRGRFVLNT